MRTSASTCGTAARMPSSTGTGTRSSMRCAAPAKRSARSGGEGVLFGAVSSNARRLGAPCAPKRRALSAGAPPRTPSPPSLTRSLGAASRCERDIVSASATGRPRCDETVRAYFTARGRFVAHDQQLLRSITESRSGSSAGRSAAQAPSEAGSRTRRSRVGEDKRPKEDPLRRTGAKKQKLQKSAARKKSGAQRRSKSRDR